jgi:mono/diheme cytochrome c family protein
MLRASSNCLPRFFLLGFTLCLSLSGILSAAALRGGEPRPPGRTPRPAPGGAKAHAATGEQIFRQRCAACHGAKGEGTKLHRKPLTGSQSAGQLAAFIRQSMPPGARQKLAAADAQKVAAYIYDAFYSPLAKARNQPARVELARLTVRQYRSAVADLLASFGRREGEAPAEPRSGTLPREGGTPADPAHGLRGEYFKAGRRRGERILERVDPEIRFDFGTAGALPEQDDPYQFAMQWEGSVLAPETGEYEFIVRTEHAVQLWVNGRRQPLIDALVKSGSDNEYRASLFLLGGRAYPLRLEFSKGVQGVNDLKKLKEKPPQAASLSLEWRPPKQATGVIPSRSLLPIPSPETFVVTAPFPPDDRSMGYERGTSVSKEWDEATTEAALETATYVVGHLGELAGVADDAADRPARLRDFCRRFVERAFRRPLTPEQQQFFVERQFQSAPDLETSVKRVVLLALKSPRFLYRELGTGRPDPYDVAARLSFGLWDSLPDEPLLKAAAAGELATREQVAAQAERMVGDPRARAKLREFFLQWLKVESHPDLAKDPKQFPEFDQAVASDLRASLELFLDDVAWSERSDFRDLLLSDRLYLNGRLAKLYGANLPPDAPFQRVSLDTGERAGVLTHPYLMASFAYLQTSSPIHRGVLIARNLLGRTLQPPPQAFTPLPVEFHPNLTTRQRVALQTQPATCMTCHGMINPLGFTLEKFDAIGRLRAQENGKPVDATGSYLTRGGKLVTFSGVHDLAQFLATSEEAQGAFVEKLVHHLVKQPIRAFGPQTLPDLQRAFASHSFSIRQEMVEIMAASALNRPAPPPGTSAPTARSRTPSRATTPPHATARTHSRVAPKARGRR